MKGAGGFCCLAALSLPPSFRGAQVRTISAYASVELFGLLAPTRTPVHASSNNSLVENTRWRQHHAALPVAATARESRRRERAAHLTGTRNYRVRLILGAKATNAWYGRAGLSPTA